MSEQQASPDRILGLGLDLAEVSRFVASLRRHGRSFAERICTGAEISEWERSGTPPGSLAASFAAKEACLKALGTGWAAGVTFRQVEILQSDGVGIHEVTLHGAALERATGMGVERIMLSLSLKSDIAAALVILLGSRPAGL